MSSLPKNGAPKPGPLSAIAGAVKKAVSLANSNGQPCPQCSTPENPVYTVAGHTGPMVTYYYCKNKDKGCKFSHQVARAGLQERMRRQLKGEAVKTPVKDGGNYGGLPPVE